MFWNSNKKRGAGLNPTLTVNMKCFEIKKRMLRSNGKLN